MRQTHLVNVRLRPLPVRLWLSYRGWRAYLGVTASIRAALYVCLRRG